MTKGDLDGLSLWGRPIKPVALGLSVLMLTLVFYNVTNEGVLGDLWLGDVVGVLAGISALTLIAGWFVPSQKMAEAGLLLAAIVYITRSAFLTFTEGPGFQGVWLGLGVSIIAAGAYLLEKTDAHARGTIRTRSTDGGTEEWTRS